jgi:hypothetical protein
VLKLFSGIWGYLAAALTGLVAILSLLLGARKAGKDAVVAEQSKEAFDNVKVAKDVERDVRGKSADAVRERLHDKWRRD